MTGSHPEEFLRTILERALDAIESGRSEHIYRRDHKTGKKVIYHLARDLEKLDACCSNSMVTTESDYWGVIQDCLESALSEPRNSFKQPEEKIASHKEVDGLEMFAFVVQLPDFTCPIYTKFCLKKQSDGTWYVSIDCHT